MHNCGAEFVAHHVNKYLISKGHEVRVMLLQHKGAPYYFDGVEVVPYAKTIEAYQWADIVCTHLDFTRHTINLCGIAKRPVFHFIHNDSVYPEIVEAVAPQFIVYNSQWIADKLSYKHKGVVLNPPCPDEFYFVPGNPYEREYITLSNLNENKGGEIFYRIAKAHHDKKFLGVIGSYDDGGIQEQTIKKLRQLPNVIVINHISDPRKIYSVTRILLVLSRYESWGRIATEAMLNGIPIIHTITDGLEENIGEAGCPIPDRGERILNPQGEMIGHDGDSYNIDSVSFWLDLLNEKSNYEMYSHMGKERYINLKALQNKQLYDFEQLLTQAKQDYKNYADACRNNRTRYVR